MIQHPGYATAKATRQATSDSTLVLLEGVPVP